MKKNQNFKAIKSDSEMKFRNKRQTSILKLKFDDDDDENVDILILNQALTRKIAKSSPYPFFRVLVNL